MDKPNIINNRTSAKSFVKLFQDAGFNQLIVLNDYGRDIHMTIEPHEDGYEFGYIGVCNGYTIKSFNRLDIISQFLMKYWVETGN